ncbi:hypothetical protein MR781_07985, partial [bacterium]|nr:hypothetical protein [bacterium]
TTSALWQLNSYAKGRWSWQKERPLYILHKTRGEKLDKISNMLAICAEKVQFMQKTAQVVNI